MRMRFLLKSGAVRLVPSGVANIRLGATRPAGIYRAMLLAPFALDTLAMMLSAQAEKMARGGE